MMDTEFEKKYISESLNRDMMSFGADRLTRDMFHYFQNITWWRKSDIQHDLRILQGLMIFDAETCENFKEWLERNLRQQDLSGDNFEEFKTLLASRNFMLLSHHMYKKRFNSLLLSSTYEADHISLKSSDNVVFGMSKMVAMSQSEVLKDMIDCTGGRDDIPVPGVPHDMLSRIISFCKKKHKFDNLFDEIAQLLKSVVDPYKAWVTGFVKSNHSIFSDLHHVANLLHIPNLLDLTSRAVKDMNGKTVEEISDWYSQMPRQPIGEVEEISEWYSTLSISRMLSPLGIEIEDSFLTS